METQTASGEERIVVLDTETTGLSHRSGDRIVEIGCVEVIGNMETGRTFHRYVSPGSRRVEEAAFKVHGLSNDFLADKPKFREVHKDFVEFVGDATIVAHNAPFDMGFIEAELALIGRPKLTNKVVDTVRVARLKYPGQKVSLDILCSRLGVDASARDLHGALIDASLLARVFIKMMGLDRLSFAHESVDQMSPASVPRTVLTKSSLPRREPRPTVVASPEENAAFLAFIAENVKTSMWGGILGLDR